MVNDRTGAILVYVVNCKKMGVKKKKTPKPLSPILFNSHFPHTHHFHTCKPCFSHDYNKQRRQAYPPTAPNTHLPPHPQLSCAEPSLVQHSMTSPVEFTRTAHPLIARFNGRRNNHALQYFLSVFTEFSDKYSCYHPSDKTSFP